MRRDGKAARGIHVAVIYTDRTHWHRGRTVKQPLYATHDIYTKALWVFNQQPDRKKVAKLSVSCFGLVDKDTKQMSLFDTFVNKKEVAADAADSLNNKYGEYVITPALMMGMDDFAVDRIAFGGVQELQDLYAQDGLDYATVCDF